MQRVTVTIDEALLAEVDRLCGQRGYQSRSEALRDIIRAAFTGGLGVAGAEFVDRDEVCHATLSYAYNHETRALASRLTSNHHAHTDLSVATTHVHMDHDNCLEVSILRGPLSAIEAFADSVISQRGVRHGALHIIPADKGTREAAHDHGHGHAH
ncbi:nickel-responsive transcriptional regulator NikR [Acuticoccus kandeliae]|uniref:nickel-responsive transcriptional regulator NikR n=1 Tax=Acuticoccus kandeliae TaxID=2073160 RepID=UPI000D3E5EE9|nr:nickel-responsive transcriptional regulator NikR [Acuticoccus kandeliae]